MPETVALISVRDDGARTRMVRYRWRKVGRFKVMLRYNLMARVTNWMREVRKRCEGEERQINSISYSLSLKCLRDVQAVRYVGPRSGSGAGDSEWEPQA